MNHLSSETFRENARAALADVHLRGALKNATSLFGERRKAAAASLPNWEELRNQARAIICRLATERNARTVVKSKSMTTEETHLNTALESAGLQVVETDLGEYIIQLANEPPSHIIAPAIH